MCPLKAKPTIKYNTFTPHPMINLSEHISRQATAAAAGLLLLTSVGGFFAGRQSLTTTQAPAETIAEVSVTEADDVPAELPKAYSMIREYPNALTDTTEYLLSIPASSPGYNSIGTREDAQLVIRCEAGKNSLFVVTPEYLSNDPQTIQVRWDDKAPTSEYWTGAKSGDALFSNAPLSTLQRLLAHNKLVIGYKPWSQVSTTAVFTLDSYQDDIKTMLAHCK